MIDQLYPAQTYKAQTPFRNCDHCDQALEGLEWACNSCSGSGCVEGRSCMLTPFIEFDEFDGGIYNGITDHSVAVGLAWQPHAMWSVI
jgi:hypothetical protein